MWDFVCGEGDVVIFVEARREQVAKRVVFFIKDEGSGVRNAFGTSEEGSMSGLSRAE